MSIPQYAINVWPGWSDFLVRGEQRIENREYGDECFSPWGGIPARVFVYATQYIDKFSFDQTAQVLGMPTGDIFWRPWASEAIVGEVTLAEVVPPTASWPERYQAIDRRFPQAQYTDVATWGRDDSFWYLITDPVRYAHPVPWSSRQGIMVAVPDDVRVQCDVARRVPSPTKWSAVTRPCWACTSRNIQTIPTGFRCTGCDRRWRPDGSEVRPNDKHPRFGRRILPHDYRLHPMSAWPTLRAEETA
jgi:hypothetical protein